MEEVLVVNQMTWPELARQCIVANVRREACLPACLRILTCWVLLCVTVAVFCFCFSSR